MCSVLQTSFQADQIVVVAVEKTFGVADPVGKTPPGLIAAVMAVAVVEGVSEAAIVVVALV